MMTRRITALLIVLTAAAVAFEDLRAQKCEKGTCANGKGVMTWPDVRYDGMWKNGTMEGFGAMEWKDGRKYTGLWKAGKFNGRGKLVWANGDQYEGNFVNGKMEGFGIMKWKSGDRYDGQWKHDKMNGPGTMRYASGLSVKGIWQDGVAVTQGKKDAANAAMAGSWQLFCKCVPRMDDVFECEGTMYTFTADGKGTFEIRGGDGVMTGKVQWTLNGKVLSITEFPEGTKEVHGPVQYIFAPAKNWYAEKPRKFGPEQKLMVVCVVKKR